MTTNPNAFDCLPFEINKIFNKSDKKNNLKAVMDLNIDLSTVDTLLNKINNETEIISDERFTRYFLTSVAKLSNSLNINIGTTIINRLYRTNIEDTKIYSYKFIKHIMDLGVDTEYRNHENEEKSQFNWQWHVNKFCLNCIESYLLECVLKNRKIRVKNIFPKGFLESMKKYYSNVYRFNKLFDDSLNSTRRSIFEKSSVLAIYYIDFLEALEDNFQDISTNEKWLKAFKMLSICCSKDVYVILKPYIFQDSNNKKISQMLLNLHSAFSAIDSIENLFEGSYFETEDEYVIDIKPLCDDPEGYLKLRQEFDLAFFHHMLSFTDDDYLYKQAKNRNMFESYLFPYLNSPDFDFYKFFKKSFNKYYYMFIKEYVNSVYASRSVIETILRYAALKKSVFFKHLTTCIGKDIMVDKYHFIDDFEFDFGTLTEYTNGSYFSYMSNSDLFAERFGFNIYSGMSIAFPLTNKTENLKNHVSSIYQMFVDAISKGQKEYDDIIDMTRKIVKKKLEYAKTHNSNESIYQRYQRYHDAISSGLFSLKRREHIGFNMDKDNIIIFEKAELTIYKILIESLVKDVNVSINTFDKLMADFGAVIFSNDVLLNLMDAVDIPQKYKSCVFKACIDTID